MLRVSLHIVMDRAVVSVRCLDYGLGHDHCVWSGGALLSDLSAATQLQAVADALAYVARRAHCDELDELTEDCLS
jgi:hypothetical protein